MLALYNTLPNTRRQLPDSSWPPSREMGQIYLATFVREICLTYARHKFGTQLRTATRPTPHTHIHIQSR